MSDYADMIIENGLMGPEDDGEREAWLPESETCNVFASVTPGLFYVGCNKGYFMEGVPDDLICPACGKPFVEQEPQDDE